MKQRETFETKAEIDAFLYGLNYVGDIDVDATNPKENIYGKWETVVLVGEEDEGGGQ